MGDRITVQWAVVLAVLWVCAVVFTDRLLFVGLALWTGGLALFYVGEQLPAAGMYRAGVGVMRLGLVALVAWVVVFAVHIVGGYQPWSDERWRTDGAAAAVAPALPDASSRGVVRGL